MNGYGRGAASLSVELEAPDSFARSSEQRLDWVGSPTSHLDQRIEAFEIFDALRVDVRKECGEAAVEVAVGVCLASPVGEVALGGEHSAVVVEVDDESCCGGVVGGLSHMALVPINHTRYRTAVPAERVEALVSLSTV